MFKKLLGINRLERNFKVVGTSLNRSWEWINHLNKANQTYEDRISRLEKSNMHLLEVTKELLNRFQEAETEEVTSQTQYIEEPVQAPVSMPVSAPVNMMSADVSLADKDLFLLQLMYQYAAFNRENAVETNVLFENLTYKITPRGLRKKLEGLSNGGLLASVKKGNSRFWFLNPGAMSKVKKALKTT
ncbi:MAG TPA: hypothetical protein VI790_01555 [Candidatus Nanoarchaeia archaeon]|nr:hypothetical protein [Candidatus Nanoarchaeia archaeon]